MTPRSAPGEEFRSIQYLGSKWRILDHVSNAIASVANSRRPRVADLFAGSGVVARRLARTHPVLASDIQEYSRVLTAALLRPKDVDSTRLLNDVTRAGNQAEPTWLRELLRWEETTARSDSWAEHLAQSIEFGSIVAMDSGSPPPTLQAASIGSLEERESWTLLRHYGGVYFSYRQAADLDLITRAIRRLDREERDTSMAALLSTATDVVSSIGSHFAQPVRPRTQLGALKMNQLGSIAAKRERDVLEVFAQKLDRFKALRPPRFDSRAQQASFDTALDELPEDVGTIYADPPYTRDHYSRFYHVLETIAVGDQPGISTVKVQGQDVASRGLYRKDRHQSVFSIVSQAPAAFERLFQTAADRGISVVLSYSPVPENEKPRARVIAMSDLLKIARQHYVDVSIVNATGMRHSKFNESSKNAPPVDEAEVLIVCRSL